MASQVILLFDIGNTNTHLGLATGAQVRWQSNIPTASWFDGTANALLEKFAAGKPVRGAVMCSVVPTATPRAQRIVHRRWNLEVLELTPRTVAKLKLGINYPKPQTIGPDRLANAVAIRHHYGAPAVVVDFGTAVTFDVVDGHGDYVGGIIAPGLAAMTEYLHEKTALLPKIKIREPRSVIGKSTKEAMLIGTVHGYRGLIRALLTELKHKLNCRRLPVVATGGYARLLAGNMPEITAVEPLLTLEGLRLVWEGNVKRGA